MMLRSGDWDSHSRTLSLDPHFHHSFSLKNGQKILNSARKCKHMSTTVHAQKGGSSLYIASIFSHTHTHTAKTQKFLFFRTCGRGIWRFEETHHSLCVQTCWPQQNGFGPWVPPTDDGEAILTVGAADSLDSCIRDGLRHNQQAGVAVVHTHTHTQIFSKKLWSDIGQCYRYMLLFSSPPADSVHPVDSGNPERLILWARQAVAEGA